MSYAEALFRVIAIAAILHSAWVIVGERWPRRRNRRVIERPTDTERFPSWRPHASHPTRRHF